MTWEEKENNTIYKVVVNHEEQYSIWPAHRENAPGWNSVGKKGMKEECLEYIKEVWTDMRPLSLRKQMEEAAQAEKESVPDEAPEAEADVRRITRTDDSRGANSPRGRTGFR